MHESVARAEVRASIRDLIIVEGLPEGHWSKQVMLSFTPMEAMWLSLLRSRNLLSAGEYTAILGEAVQQEMPRQTQRQEARR